MIVAFVLGNGTSRLKISTHQLKQHGLLIGCNLAYQDNDLDAVCAVDQPMIYNMIEKNDVIPFIDSQNAVRFPNARVIDTTLFKRMDSGTLALLTAVHLGATQVFLLGFDYISNTGNSNNVYAGNAGYHLATDPHADKSITDIWGQNHNQVCLQCPDTNFLRINNNGYIPKISASNFYNITEQQFLDTFIGK